MDNRLLVTDKQHEVAASPRLLPAGQRQRWTSHNRTIMSSQSEEAIP